MTPDTSIQTAYDELVAAIVKVVPEIERAVTYKEHPIRVAIAKLIQDRDIRKMSLRDIAFAIGMPKASPQKIKHHVEMLYRIDNLKPRAMRPITLEDVLRAIHEQGAVRFVTYCGGFFTKTPFDSLNPEHRWEMGKSLAWHRDNAPKTITFLHSLLCK